MMNEELRMKFDEAVESLVKLLREEVNPHASAIVTTHGFEVVEGIYGNMDMGSASNRIPEMDAFVAEKEAQVFAYVTCCKKCLTFNMGDTVGCDGHIAECGQRDACIEAFKAGAGFSRILNPKENEND
ncbi:MAG: hypothetical protein LBN29_01260 [Mediterranea sp.]|jgi:hypothetical protein|nr:hypothetical protein [Mediterranea sp.]